MIDEETVAKDGEILASSSQVQESIPIGSQSSQLADPSTDGSANQAQTTASDDNPESAYHLKWIPWNSGKIPIIMQSINGPCPLIATMNVLLLREKVKLPPMLEQITATQLLTYLGECLTDSVPDEIRNDEAALLNFEQNIHDAIEILPKLKTGLDVNIKFAGITNFEYTPECIIFDILRIPLYHGWLSDPELRDTIGCQSYNQLVDYIITNKTSIDPQIQARVLLAEEFLEQTASQLTIYGLHELKTKIKENEIGILFRNNHFLTLFKREHEIYTLVTDHGYLTEDNIIWEILDNIEGAGRFFDANFKLAELSAVSKQATAMNNIEQILEDYLMALELEKEGTGSGGQAPNTITEGSIVANETRRNRSGTSLSEPCQAFQVSPEDDFELAKRLQDEENRMYDEMMRQRQSDTVGQSAADNSALPTTGTLDAITTTTTNNTELIQSNRSRTGLRQTRSQFVAADQAEQADTIDLQDNSSFPPLISNEQAQQLPKAQMVPDLTPRHEQIDQLSTDIAPGYCSEKANCSRDPEVISSDVPSTATPKPDTNSRPITVIATPTSNLSRQQTDRSRQRSEKNTKETTCIVH